MRIVSHSPYHFEAPLYYAGVQLLILNRPHPYPQRRDRLTRQPRIGKDGDDLLGKLSVDLNATYVAFGARGERGRQNQMEQDANAAELSSEAKAQRAKTKASKLYHCSWDLVDAVGKGDVELATIKREDLPVDMREMTDEERLAHVDDKRAERQSLEKRIATLSARRDAFVKEEMVRRELDDTQSFDNALRGAIREQAQAAGFTFAK